MKRETELESKISIARKIYEAWNHAWANDDIEAVLALYHETICVESPLIPHLMQKQQGICQGKEALKHLLKLAASRKPKLRKYFKHPCFTDGETLIWEYPRKTPVGEQMDFVEVMQIEQGLIKSHRVYWGWLGYAIMKQDRYWRD